MRFPYKIKKWAKDHPRKSVLLLIALILLIIFVGYQFYSAQNPAMDLKVVEVEKVKHQDLQQTINLIGTIKPKQSTMLVARSTGTLDLIAHSGQTLQKGDLIAKIDNPDVEKTYELSEVAEKIAKTQYERIDNLHKPGHASAHEVDERKNAWIEAQKLRASAKIDFDRTRFYAPFNGKVGVFKKREGTQVNEGQPIVNFYDPSSLRVVFDIPASVIQFVKEGQLVRVEGKTFPLSNVQPMIDEETHMCPADVDIKCDKCIIGSSVDVDLVIQSKHQIIAIPFDAILFRNDNTFVYRVENSKVILTPVRLGIREKENVEILDGLKAGQDIIVKGKNRIQPHMMVKIEQPQKSVK